MAIAPQTPGELSISLCRGDDYSTLVDLSISIVGYTWSAAIYSLSTGTTLVYPTISVVNASAGTFTVSITDTQAATLPPGTLGIRIDWTAPGDMKRRAFEGVCEVLR
ncbi:hypothetical protein EBZ38_17575 [bacterium]|nr:hypothetical protein [bacterium]